ncbi:MAG: transglycosylase domain-containing protein [Tannerellaceae bacterium]|nr:transglycosylase domain-containing protein [Tannerellaceae bacterium]
MTSRYAARKFQAIEKQYGLNIRYNSVSLNGYNSILIKGLTIVSGNPDVLMYANSFVIKANFWKSNFSREDVNGFEIRELHIRHARAKRMSDGRPDYASLIKRALEKTAFLYAFLPPYVSIRDIYFSCQNKENEQTYHLPALTISGNRLMAEAPGQWVCHGMYNENFSRISLRLYAKEHEKVNLPFVTDYAGATVKFDTLSIDLQTKKNIDNVQILQGGIGAKGLLLHHKSLSPDVINIGRLSANYRLFVGENFLEVDSSATSVRYRQLSFNPFLRIEKNRKWTIRAALDKNDFPADNLFTSLPEGLFKNLDGLRVSGTLSYHFLLNVNMAMVNNLVFESVVRPRNFKIVKYGNTDLSKMSKPFTHQIYSKDKMVRSFEVGVRNPDFRPFNAISRYLPPAIMHGEDFAFYNHRGFYSEAFHKSLVENISTGSFQRGASTLSMQLVKNVFLNQDKTMARKLEEILIVWLIENNRLTSKSRMFEVYMNIIEWGPNVYGITEAARFYFAKDPSTLTLGECIFLAYIIPNPRYLRNYFTGSRLKYQYYEFFSDAVRRMAQRNLISWGDAARANADVNFRGQALEYLTR